MSDYLSPAFAAFLDDCRHWAEWSRQQKKQKKEEKQMTLTIEVAPEKEAILRQKAAQRGQSLNDYVRLVVEHDADDQGTTAAPMGAEKAAAARLAAVRSIGAYDTRAAAGLPPLSDADLSRESIYEGRGL